MIKFKTSMKENQFIRSFECETILMPMLLRILVRAAEYVSNCHVFGFLLLLLLLFVCLVKANKLQFTIEIKGRGTGF